MGEEGWTEADQAWAVIGRQMRRLEGPRAGLFEGGQPLVRMKDRPLGGQHESIPGLRLEVRNRVQSCNPVTLVRGRALVPGLRAQHTGGGPYRSGDGTAHVTAHPWRASTPLGAATSDGSSLRPSWARIRS